MSDGLLPNLTPMSLPEFGYLAPSTLDEAIKMLLSYGKGARVMAGGSDLLHLMKRGAAVPVPKVIVDIKGIEELRSLSFDQTVGLELGSLVTVNDIGESDLVAEHYPLLNQTVDYISSPQVRNVATVGGALSQQVWCWFLRNGMKCWRAGGEMCYAAQKGADTRYYHSVMGGNDCYAVHPSDLAVALEALDASVAVRGPHGTRTMSIAQFLPGNVQMDGVFQSHVLTQADVVTRVSVPPPAQGTRSVFLKTRVRNAFDFAIASVAVVLALDGMTVKDPKIVFGGVAPAPYRDTEAESTLGGLDLYDIDPAATSAAALAAAVPLQNNGYKVDVARGLLREALLGLAV